MADRPCLLLVPSLTELEWTIRPLLEEWADVVSYDAPGVGREPAAQGMRSEATARRGLAEVDRLGPQRCVVVADELGSLAGVLLVRARLEAVRAVVLGHPLVSLDLAGDRPSLNEGVMDAHIQLAEASHRAFIREQFRAWVGLRGEPAPLAEGLAEAFLARVPHTVATSFYAHVRANLEHYEREIRAALRRISHLPTLLVHHEGCLMFTREGFERAAAAMPHAQVAATQFKPSVDPAFVDILREFVESSAG